MKNPIEVLEARAKFHEDRGLERLQEAQGAGQDTASMLRWLASVEFEAAATLCSQAGRLRITESGLEPPQES